MPSSPPDHIEEAFRQHGKDSNKRLSMEEMAAALQSIFGSLKTQEELIVLIQQSTRKKNVKNFNLADFRNAFEYVDNEIVAEQREAQAAERRKARMEQLKEQVNREAKAEQRRSQGSKDMKKASVDEPLPQQMVRASHTHAEVLAGEMLNSAPIAIKDDLAALEATEKAKMVSDGADFASQLLQHKDLDSATCEELEAKLERQKTEVLELRAKLERVQPAAQEAEELGKQAELLQKQLKWHQEAPEEFLSPAAQGKSELNKRVGKLEQECKELHSEVEGARLSNYLHASSGKALAIQDELPLEEEEDILGALFYNHDNGDGYLELNSLAACLEELFGPDLATHDAVINEAKIVLPRLDADGNGKIELREFYHVFEHLDRHFSEMVGLKS